MANEPVRVLRLENRCFCASDRVFAALTDPARSEVVPAPRAATAGTHRLEPRVGGAQYEDWARSRLPIRSRDRVDPPRRYSVRSRLHAGTIMDTTATFRRTGGHGAALSRVIMGP